jgi:hypothetical protein
MIESQELIMDFIKEYPIGFWIGLTIIVLGLFSFVLILVLKRRKKKKGEIRIKWELESKRIETERNLIKKRHADEIALQNKTQQEEESLKEKPQILNYSSSQTEKLNLKEPETTYTTKNKLVENSPKIEIVKPNVKSTEQLPEAKKEEKKEISENLFVNYQLKLAESKDNYAVIRIPNKGCIVRTHRFGSTKRRGFKEESFQESLQKYFGSYFIVSGVVRLNTGKETRPYEPDIAIIDNKTDNNIRIDIEIDEPYAGITRQPTHCKGDDLIRDTYFADRGWLVIRFSEYQVHTQELECLKYIAFILKSINSNYAFANELSSSINLLPEKLWDTVQAQKWEKAKYREQYLNHTFGNVPEEKETVERGFNEQEVNEEKLVKPTPIGVPDKGRDIGFNKLNVHSRDKRIVFYPESHVYTIDNAPVPSASTIISKFFPEFDSVYWSIRKAPELGMSPEEVALMWKTKGEKAANEGTFLHEQIENYYLGQSYQRTNEFHLFEQFVNDHQNQSPYRTEWRIFDEDFSIAGTIDLIAKNGHGFEIYDWKRSKKVVNQINGAAITNNQWQSGVGALDDISDTSYNRYCLQQSLYRYILEKKYDLQISNMFLIVIYPDYDRYYKVETPYWKDRIEYILKTI